MSDHKETDFSSIPSSGGDVPKAISRRAVLRGGITAMPAILTLQSGAALARSSNLISASSTETVDGLGRTLCLDTNTVEYADGSARIFDLQEPPQPATVNIITPREYHVEANNGSPTISAGEACERGGPIYYKPDSGPWQTINLPQTPRAGAVVSSGAMLSMSDHIIDNLI